MKKIIALTLTAFMLALTATVSFAGCGANSADPDVVTQTPYESSPDVSSDALSGAEDTQPAESSEPEPADSESGSNILIAYFSWADNAVIEGEVDVVASPSVTAPGRRRSCPADLRLPVPGLRARVEAELAGTLPGDPVCR